MQTATRVKTCRTDTTSDKRYKKGKRYTSKTVSTHTVAVYPIRFGEAIQHSPRACRGSGPWTPGACTMRPKIPKCSPAFSASARTVARSMGHCCSESHCPCLPKKKPMDFGASLWLLFQKVKWAPSKNTHTHTPFSKQQRKPSCKSEAKSLLGEH